MTKIIAPVLRLTATYVPGEYPKDYEKGGGKSATIPDQSMTIQQLMDRAMAGIPPDVREMYFEEEMDHDDFDLSQIPNMDIAEASELLEAVKVKHEVEQKSIMDAIAERKRREKSDEFEAQKKTQFKVADGGDAAKRKQPAESIKKASEKDSESDNTTLT